MSNSTKIIKNTMFLYFRMLCVMLVSLYTVRVTLMALGVDDYGVYQTVGGIVGLLAFINSTLGTGSSRFLTFELGTGNKERLQQTFSTLLVAHGIIAGFITILAELVGMWYIGHYLNIPVERNMTGMIVFQLSVITAVIEMTQIPYTAVIIAHEQLKVYAYVSLVEVIFKLGISYLIVMIPSYRLECYALLVCVVQITVMLLYRVYCYRNYKESHFCRQKFNHKILKTVGSFSAWSLFAQLSVALMNQGTVLLLNTFFSPAIVAARVIALQVNAAAQQFLNNFRTAANPQIVKKYASGDFHGSQDLLIKSTYFSYYLMLVLAIPIILLSDPMLRLWLHDVPDYAVVFLQWSMVQSLFGVFDASLYTALYTRGRVKENALISPTFGFLIVPLEFYLFQVGYSPLVVCYLATLYYAVLGIIIKPILVCKIAKYRPRIIFMMFLRCGLVTGVSVLMVNYFLSGIDGHEMKECIEIIVTSITITCMVIYFIGMNKAEREMIIILIKKKLNLFNRER